MSTHPNDITEHALSPEDLNDIEQEIKALLNQPWVDKKKIAAHVQENNGGKVSIRRFIAEIREISNSIFNDAEQILSSKDLEELKRKYGENINNPSQFYKMFGIVFKILDSTDEQLIAKIRLDALTVFFSEESNEKNYLEENCCEKVLEEGVVEGVREISNKQLQAEIHITQMFINYINDLGEVNEKSSTEIINGYNAANEAVAILKGKNTFSWIEKGITTEGVRETGAYFGKKPGEIATVKFSDRLVCLEAHVNNKRDELDNASKTAKATIGRIVRAIKTFFQQLVSDDKENKVPASLSKNLNTSWNSKKPDTSADNIVALIHCNSKALSQ